MRLPVKISLLLIACSYLLPSPSLAAEQIAVAVYLNTEPKGTFFGYVSSDRRDLFLTEADLRSLGLEIKGREETIDGSAYVSIRSLQPQVSHEFREKEIALHLNASPEVLGTTTIDLHKTAPKGTVALAADSAFVNYSVNYSADEEFGYQSLAIPLEAGVRWHDLLFFSNFSYFDDEKGDKLTRLFSYVLKDDTRDMRRYTFGDYNAYSGELGGGATMGGIKISKNYSLDPYFLISPGLSLQGQLQTPADVELWRNGTLLETRKLGPGSFEFLNVPGITGAGEAEVIVRDAFGGEQHLTYPFYFSSNLLKKGLHEYDYNVGFRRQAFGAESSSYDDLTGIFFHRYGFTDTFTGGVRGEFADQLTAAGVSAAYVYRQFGAFSLAAAVSNIGGEAGHAASFGYSFTGEKYFSANLTYRIQSQDYGNLSVAPGDDKARSEWLASAAFHMPPWGNVNLFYNAVDRFAGEDTERFTVRYSKNLTRNLNFEVSASTIHGDTTEHEFYLTLNYFFGNGTSLYASVGKTDGEQSRSITLQRSPPARLGTGYRLQAMQTKFDEGDDSQRYDAEISHYGRYGDYTARVNSVDNIENYTLRASGSLAAVNGSLYPGPRIDDAFAVIKVGELEGVEVSRSNSPVGRTDGRGEVLVPGMLSNYANKISFNKQDIPLNFQYDSNEKYISPPYRGGVYVGFPIAKFQSVIGRLFVRGTQGARPAELWRLDLQAKDGVIEVPVGRGGDFYLDNLAQGSYRATLTKGEERCGLVIQVPESQEPLVDVGDLYCEMD